MKYAAIIKDTEQCGPDPDDWRDSPKIKEIQPLTTLQDLIDWQKKLYPNYKKLQKDNTIVCMTITIMV